MSLFDGRTGHKPQTEARRWLYGALARLLEDQIQDRDDPRLALGPEGDEFDRRRLYAALIAVKNEMLRRQKTG